MTDLGETRITNTKTSATAAENLSFRPSLLNRDSGWANIIDLPCLEKALGTRLDAPSVNISHITPPGQ
jgi:hypothetical protein